jgi:hypothetical protein
VGTAAIWGGSPPLFLAVTPGVRNLTSALLFRKRKQKHKDTQSREDRRGDEASRRNLSTRVKTHFQLSGDTD